jgi:hypothetical protein
MGDHGWVGEGEGRARVVRARLGRRALRDARQGEPAAVLGVQHEGVIAVAPLRVQATCMHSQHRMRHSPSAKTGTTFPVLPLEC